MGKSTRHDDAAGMSPERRAEVARELGLDDLPTPRYEDLPEIHDSGSAAERWNFMKAIACVDPIASAAFMNYLPSRIPIDQSMDARIFRRGWTWTTSVDTSKPIPVNRKITAATGITSDRNEKNWYTWCAQHILWKFEESGARAMSPVLVWRTRGERSWYGKWKAKPVLGVIFKLDRTPRMGLRMEDMVAQVGLLHPSTMRAKNKVTPVAQITVSPEGSEGGESLGGGNGARISSSKQPKKT